MKFRLSDLIWIGLIVAILVGVAAASYGIEEILEKIKPGLAMIPKQPTTNGCEPAVSKETGRLPCLNGTGCDFIDPNRYKDSKGILSKILVRQGDFHTTLNSISLPEDFAGFVIAHYVENPTELGNVVFRSVHTIGSFGKIMYFHTQNTFTSPLFVSPLAKGHKISAFPDSRNRGICVAVFMDRDQEGAVVRQAYGKPFRIP